MTALLDQAYGPGHPLWLGDETLPVTPAAAAVMAAAADLEQMHREGHTLGPATTEGRLIVRLAEHGGNQADVLTLIDAGVFRSARSAWQQWAHRPHDNEGDDE